MTAMVWTANRIGGRPANLAEFFAEGLTRDAIGEQHGVRHLGTYFRNVASGVANS